MLKKAVLSLFLIGCGSSDTVTRSTLEEECRTAFYQCSNQRGWGTSNLQKSKRGAFYTTSPTGVQIKTLEIGYPKSEVEIYQLYCSQYQAQTYLENCATASTVFWNKNYWERLN
jgi:hypothetical protein